MAHLFAVSLAHRNPHGLGRRLATLYTYAQPRIGDKKFVAESDRLLHKCAASGFPEPACMLLQWARHRAPLPPMLGIDAERAACRKHYRVANAIDIVPRVPPTKSTWLPISSWSWVEKALGRDIIEYHHAGISHLGEKVIQVRPCACWGSRQV